MGVENRHCRIIGQHPNALRDRSGANTPAAPAAPPNLSLQNWRCWTCWRSARANRLLRKIRLAPGQQASDANTVIVEYFIFCKERISRAGMLAIHVPRLAMAATACEQGGSPSFPTAPLP